MRLSFVAFMHALIHQCCNTVLEALRCFHHLLVFVAVLVFGCGYFEILSIIIITRNTNSYVPAITNQLINH